LLASRQDQPPRHLHSCANSKSAVKYLNLGLFLFAGNPLAPYLPGMESGQRWLAYRLNLPLAESVPF